MRLEQALKNQLDISPLVLTSFPLEKIIVEKNIYLSFSGWLHETGMPKVSQQIR